MLLGLLKPDGGSISVFGRDSHQHGYVPERPTLYEWMTAAEIGWFTAGFYPDGFEQHYRNLLDRYRVPPARKISKMSKGMRAKVALSLAMAHQPNCWCWTSRRPASTRWCGASSSRAWSTWRPRAARCCSRAT